MHLHKSVRRNTFIRKVNLSFYSFLRVVIFSDLYNISSVIICLIEDSTRKPY